MLRKGFIYLLLTYSIQMFNILLNILLIRFLSLEQLGSITLAKIYFQSMDYMHVGTRMAIDRMVPVQKERDALVTLNISSFVTLVMSVNFVLIIYLFVTNEKIVLLFMLAGIFYSLANLVKAFYRAQENFFKMMYLTIAILFIPLIVQVIGLYFFGYNGFIYSTFAIYLILFFLMLLSYKFVNIFKINNLISTIKSIFNAGGINFINSAVIFFAFSIDKIILEYYSGKETLGEYSIVLFVFSMLLIVPTSLAEIIFPSIVKSIHSNESLNVIKYILFLFISSLIIIMILNICMDYVILNYIQKYEYLLNYFHLISWSVLIYSINPVFYHILNAYDERMLILKSSIYATLILVIYFYIVIYFNLNIQYYFIIGKYIFGLIILLIYIYIYYDKILGNKYE